ncbi:hypothetical protein [Bacillus sp. JJ1764]|uniref:hypothetical protein n=1 Tax=Bacillus sp. JJ1764 TaxID=3122964 RepID=UPI003000F708
MPVRKFSFLLLMFSIIAGLLGALIGEWLLDAFYGVWPNILLIGAYFGVLALLFGLFCLLAELMTPVINGRRWRLEGARTLHPSNAVCSRTVISILLFY